MIDVSVVLRFLRPDAQWALGDSTNYDSLVWLSQDISVPSLEEIEEAWPAAKYEHYMTNVRFERNKLLVASDWTQMLDVSVNRDAWAEYRQALRDLPENTIDPENPVWPTPPA